MQIVCPSPNAITKLSTKLHFYLLLLLLVLLLFASPLPFTGWFVCDFPFLRIVRKSRRNLCVCVCILPVLDAVCWCSCILVVVYIFCHCHTHSLLPLLLWCFFIAFWLHIRHKWWFVVNLHKRINQNGTYTSRSVNWQNMLWENGKMHGAADCSDCCCCCSSTHSE